ncbi:hypothetical protein BUALT_Bualt08G0025300 [Buddleja alternifolia]|uniref:Bifunctional inhibitor/plant lipid transfer protein/seed storage helical domain-containing protein n=1 Tax=Buddleja alternifolia TaxID=168488 RepID=A0AAV6XE14_9LAMI|nr:hypothetical protein BUALT_Bualt08G0025300 [Buddleja alternifolia]
MVSFWTVTCILVTCAAVVGRSAAQIAPSQPPAEGPGTAADCSTLIYNMMDCMTFLSNGDNETKPDASCCSGFKSVVDTDAECICYAMSTAASLGMDINMTKAETIPSSCGVTGVPPISSCSANPPAANTPSLSPTTQPPAAASPTTQPPSAASPTTEPPSAASSPGGAPAALSPSGTTGAPAPAHKKSGAYTISATSSTLFIILYSLSLLFTAWI